MGKILRQSFFFRKRYFENLQYGIFALVISLSVVFSGCNEDKRMNVESLVDTTALIQAAENYFRINSGIGKVKLKTDSIIQFVLDSGVSETMFGNCKEYGMYKSQINILRDTLLSHTYITLPYEERYCFSQNKHFNNLFLRFRNGEFKVMGKGGEQYRFMELKLVKNQIIVLAINMERVGRCQIFPGTDTIYFEIEEDSITRNK